MTRKQIDRHLAGFEFQEDNHFLSEVQIKNFRICQAWAYIRPVVMFVRPLLFFKPKWQQAITIAAAAFDAGCDVNQ